MIELTTLNVSKKGENLFVPKIRPKITVKNKHRIEGDSVRIKREDKHEVGSAINSPETNEIHKTISSNDLAENKKGGDHTPQPSLIVTDACKNLIRDQEVESQSFGNGSLLPTVTPSFRSCLDSIPGVMSTKNVISNILIIPEPDTPISKISIKNGPSHKSAVMKFDSVLDSSTIQSTSLEVLIKHKFKQGVLSKTEKRRIEASTEMKMALKKNQSDQSSETSNTGSKISNDFLVNEKKATAVPRLVMVDGKIRMDHSSLLVRRKEADVDLEEIDEGAQRLVTSSSFLTSRNTKKVKWTKELTEKFYEGLSYFGTDFGLISVLLQGIDRRQIKSKFNIEERVNGWKLTAALKNRKPIRDVADILRRNLIMKKSCPLPDSSTN